MARMEIPVKMDDQENRGQQVNQESLGGLDSQDFQVG